VPLPRSLVEVHAQCAAAVRLQRGEVLQIIDPYGEQVADLAIFNAESCTDAFSPGRTIDYNESLIVSSGSVLYSHAGVALARIIEDSVGVHDILIAPCSSEMFARRGEFQHPSCQTNLSAALANFGIGADMVATTLNVFMNVAIEEGGGIKLGAPASAAGDFIKVEALCDLVVGIAACSSERTNNGKCKPICYLLLPSFPAR
jgi:uncharacterized protein YcgI (DUF1989 family)